MVHLTTFSDDNMSIAAKICVASARQQGINKAFLWTAAALKQTDFYKNNKALLDQPRGSGFWAWKPFIMLDALQRIKDGDYLVYSDAGVEFVNSIKHITDRMTGDIWLFGNQYQHIHWCKADVMKVINCWDSGSQVQASVIIIRNSQNAKQFVDEWLTWCTVSGMIDDSPSKCPNHPEFQEHRHDQSILTTLAYREKITPFHWWPAMYNCGAFTYDHSGYPDAYAILFHHHRCRNNEIAQPGIFRDYFHKKYPDIV